MSSPNDTLCSFMKEMNEWEKKCAAKDLKYGDENFKNVAQEAMKDYNRIFSRYCSKTNGTPRTFFYSNPPDYDPDGEVIVTIKYVSCSLVEIQTQQNYGWQEKRLYRLALEEGQWKLFEKQILTDDGEVIHASL